MAELRATADAPGPSGGVRAIPRVRRAREYRIYDESGRRYLDLYQDGGHAVLGHRPADAGRTLKNLFSRGLAADYPSRAETRVFRAFQTLIPEVVDLRWYRSRERARAAAMRQLGTDDEDRARVCDPLIEGVADAPVCLWRPFLPEPFSGAATRILVPVLPVPESMSPVVLLFLRSVVREVPDSDVVSALVLETLTRSIYDLVGEVTSRERTGWSGFDAPFWRRSGAYLVFTCPEREFLLHFEQLLSRGILVSPLYPGPSIIPGRYSPGELQALRNYMDRGV